MANSRFRGFRLYRLDIHGLAENVVRKPSSFGFVDVSTPCRQSGRCHGFLFWDHVHPTSQAHSHLAQAAFRILAE
jgi:phospholipase/lecithinase/hemolysin